MLAQEKKGGLRTPLTDPLRFEASKTIPASDPSPWESVMAIHREIRIQLDEIGFGVWSSPARASFPRRLAGVLGMVALGLIPPGALGQGVTASRACQAPDPATGMGVVEGRAQDRATRVSLGLATVRLLPADSGEVLEGRTDLSGAFSFCSVPGGRWGIEAWIGDRQAHPRPIIVTPGERTVLFVELFLPSDGARPGILSGLVVEAESGVPVRGATVQILGSPRRTFSDDAGHFSFPFLKPGPVHLRVTRLGYQTADGLVEVGGGQEVAVEVRMATEAIPLEPIVVTATRKALTLPGALDLERRVNSGWGEFVLSDEIELRSPTKVTDLLRGTGVEVLGNGAAIFMRRSGCAPLVYMDDQKLTRCPRGQVSSDCNPYTEAAEAVNLLVPAMIYAIEIYRGPAQTPGQYLDSNSRCGVILIWTRRGGGG